MICMINLAVSPLTGRKYPRTNCVEILIIRSFYPGYLLSRTQQSTMTPFPNVKLAATSGCLQCPSFKTGPQTANACFGLLECVSEGYMPSSVQLSTNKIMSRRGKNHPHVSSFYGTARFIGILIGWPDLSLSRS